MRTKRTVHAACGAVMLLPLSGCISVATPDKPIEINLHVTIEQEVLVKLQRDVEQLIEQNPETFPQPQPPQPQQPQPPKQ